VGGETARWVRGPRPPADDYGRRAFRPFPWPATGRRTSPVGPDVQQRMQPGRLPERHASGVLGTELRRPGCDDLWAGARAIVLRLPGSAVQVTPLDVGRRTFHRDRDLR